MKVIERPRVSGKTTMLLHYMEINPWTLYVTRTVSAAKQAFTFSQNHGLHLTEENFVSMVDKRIEQWKHRYEILVDDADYIVKCHPYLGYNLIAQASIITISKGEKMNEMQKAPKI